MTPATAGDGNELTQKGRSSPHRLSISTTEPLIPSSARALSCRAALVRRRVKSRATRSHMPHRTGTRSGGVSGLCAPSSPRQRVQVKKSSTSSAPPGNENVKSTRASVGRGVISTWSMKARLGVLS